MTNPMMMMIQAMQQGKNPAQLLQQQAASNPQLQQLQQIVGGKTPQQLREVAENMLRQRGMTYEQAQQMIAQQYGLQIPTR